MGTDEESLKSIKKAAAMGKIRSLDEPISNDGEDIYIGDTIASKENIEADVIDRIDSDIMSRELWAAVDRLPDLQGKVLSCRFLEKKTYQYDQSHQLLHLPLMQWYHRYRYLPHHC